VTDKGLVRIGDLVSRAASGETFDVYTNDLTSESESVDRIVATQPLRYMVTGTNEIVELRFSNGSRLRCTPNHRVWTANRGWVRAENLEATDRVARSLHQAARPMASEALPASALVRARAAAGQSIPLIEKWDEEFAHYLGWLVGDGCLTNAGAVTVYGSADEQREVMPRHAKLLERLTGHGRKPSMQQNGTTQLRAMNAQLRGLLAGLGVTTGRAPSKVVPEAVFRCSRSGTGRILARALRRGRMCRE